MNRLANRVLVVLFLGWPVAGCSGNSAAGPVDEDRTVTLKLTSDDFREGQSIPRVCTGEGEDRSPHLAWSKPPQETRELALICDDPDAPTPKPWVHWVLYGIAPDVVSLPAGLPPEKLLTPATRSPAGQKLLEGREVDRIPRSDASPRTRRTPLSLSTVCTRYASADRARRDQRPGTQSPAGPCAWRRAN